MRRTGVHSTEATSSRTAGLLRMRTIAACLAVLLAASGGVAMASGLVYVDVVANIIDDGSLAVTDVRTFDVTDEHHFVAWDVPSHGATDIEVLGFSGPGGAYTRVDVPVTGAGSTPRTYYVVEDAGMHVVYGWFRPQTGRVDFRLRYRVSDAASSWGDPARIYRLLAEGQGGSGTHSVRLVYNEDIGGEGEPPAGYALFVADNPWLGTTDGIVERFSVWFGLVIATLALLLLALSAWWERRLRGRSIVGTSTSEPPFGITPAVAGRLVRGGVPRREDFEATVLDLVDRGVLSVEGPTTPGGGARIHIDRTRADRAEPHEWVLVRLMFDRHKARQVFEVPDLGVAGLGGVRVRATTTCARLLWGVAIARQSLKRELAVPHGGRSAVARVAVALLIAAAGVPALVLARAWWVFFATCASAAAVAVVGSVVLRLTDIGMNERRAYQAFCACLDDAAGCAGRLRELEPLEWKRAFVLATEFGCADDGWVSEADVQVVADEAVKKLLAAAAVIRERGV